MQTGLGWAGLESRAKQPLSGLQTAETARALVHTRMPLTRLPARSHRHPTDPRRDGCDLPAPDVYRPELYEDDLFMRR